MNMIFMGRKSYAAKMLEWTVEMGINIIAVVTDSHLKNSPTELKAKELGIKIVSLEEAEEIVKNEHIDIVVSYLFWKKIKEPMISSPKYGCINFHPAILPDWKGLGGYNIAILEKLSEWGATAHFVDESIDTGKIIKIYKFNFDYRYETAQSLEKKTQSIQIELYKSIITDLMESKILNSYSQDNCGKYISKKDMLEMMEIKKGDNVDLKVQAFWFPPYSGAYINIDGKKYTLINEYILKQLADKNETYNI